MGFEQTATLTTSKQDQCISTTCTRVPQEALKETSLEQTLSIIKPDSVVKNNIGGIINLLEKSGLRIVAQKMVQLSKEEAEEFYAIHKERSFFPDLVKFMISGPCVVMVLEGENAVLRNRDVMGATDPKKAAKGTIRAEFAENIDANAVHGSDSLENAKNEIKFFFDCQDVHSRKN